MFYGIYDQIFNKSNESFRVVAMLTQYKGNLRKFLKDGSWPNNPIIKQNLLNRRFSNYKVFLKLLLLQLFLDVDIKPITNRLPKILLIDVAIMQTPKEYPTLFEIINIIFDILSHCLEGVSVDYGNVEDYFVLLELEIIAELFEVLFVLVET